jgi:hypothetical protein
MNGTKLLCNLKASIARDNRKLSQPLGHYDRDWRWIEDIWQGNHPGGGFPKRSVAIVGKPTADDESMLVQVHPVGLPQLVRMR